MLFLIHVDIHFTLNSATLPSPITRPQTIKISSHNLPPLDILSRSCPQEEKEYTLVNGRVVPKTADTPAPSEKDMEAFLAETMEKAMVLSQERLNEAAQEFGRPMDADIPRNFAPDPAKFADADSEEELRQRIAEEKLKVGSGLLFAL